MNKTTENLWQALREYNPPETKPVVFRLCYDINTGKPTDLTTNDVVNENKNIGWIEISREEADTYPHQDPRVKIVDGKIHRTIKKISTVEEPNQLKIKKSCTGNIVTDDYSMLIINSEGKNKWKYA